MSPNEPISVPEEIASNINEVIVTDLLTPQELCILWGRKIKEIRIFKNITQEQLAQKVGVVRKSISSLERGHGRFDLFVHVIQALDMAQMLTDTLNKKINDDIKKIKRTEEVPIIIAKRQRVR